jgi:hypothetical protein
LSLKACVLHDLDPRIAPTVLLHARHDDVELNPQLFEDLLALRRPGR